MLEISEKILKDYQVRKTRKQKTEFIDFLKKELKDTKIEIEEGGLFKSRNIVVGDLEKCEIVLGAHYDTQPVLPFPNFLAPKNMLAYLLYCFLLFAGIFTIGFVMMFVLLLLFDNMNLALVIYYILLLGLIAWMFVGKANKHTANDNTSGVITLIEALHNDDIKDKVCCVFFDHEEIGLFGSAAFAKKHKEILKDKLVMNFDCVSDGDYIMFVINKKAKEVENKLKESFKDSESKKFLFESSTKTLYPSDQVNFKKAIGVAAFKRKKFVGYYMDRIHTKKDTIFERENIETIIEGLKNFVS